MVNYLGKFLPDLSSVLKPLNDLLKASSAWVWDQAQEQAFEKVKQMMSTTPVLAFYDPKLRAVVSVDASSQGRIGLGRPGGSTRF